MSASWPLIGRAAEVDLRNGILATRGAGGVVLSGVAGVGKTRLAGEFVRHADATGRATAWAAASRALAVIPFGAFAHLLAADDVPAGSPLDVLRRAHSEIRRRSPDRPLVLVVDDAHLLDDASAGLVHQLAAAGTAFVVATVCDGYQVPDAVRALWMDGLAERLELLPLSGPGVGDLLAAALNGQVETATVQRLWRASEGNVLLLRELVLVGTAQGVLARRHGVWSWRGELRGSPRLAELIDDRLAGLGAEQRAALEVLAVGEPLPLALFERVVGVGTADCLEAAGLLGIVGDSAQLAHPLYGEAVRAQLRPLRRRAVCRDLAGGAAEGDSDLLRLVGWQLDGGIPAGADLLIAGARRAANLGDRQLAERLARAGVAAGGGLAAGLVLAEALQSQDRVHECQSELDGLVLDGADPAIRARWAVVAATNAFWIHGDAASADTVLVQAQSQLPDGELRDELDGHRAELLASGGRPVEALAVARRACRRPAANEDTRLRIGRATVFALAVYGQTERAIATADRLLSGPGCGREDRPLLLDMTAAARMHAYCFSGRYVELEALTTSLDDRWAATASHDLRGMVVGLRGRAQLGRGTLRSARLNLRESVAVLREHDVLGFLPLMLSLLARAEAQLGERDRAESTLAACERVFGQAIRIQLPYLMLARAWTASCAGRARSAGAHALQAADEAAAMQCHPIELEALHEAVRFGEHGLAQRLATVAARVDCVVADDYVAHSGALARGDGRALDLCAGRFADSGLYLLAAEVAVEAAEAHAKSGRRVPERDALDRAHRWAEHCEGARTPALVRGRQAPLTSWLTVREREIAELAMTGLSNADIADRLVLSRRTVGNHLNSVYGKLGVEGRTQLADRLTPHAAAPVRVEAPAGSPDTR